MPDYASLPDFIKTENKKKKIDMGIYYFVGCVITYFIVRKKLRRITKENGNTYTWSHVFAVLIFAAFSIIGLAAFLLLDFFMNDKHKEEPPSFL